MTAGPRVTPGPAATPADRRAARRAQDLLAHELPRVREAAHAWRNGLAGLFVGLLGFGLVKGRTDVSKLAPPYGALVGAALLLSLLCGTVAVLHLLRAAHGAPRTVPLATGTGADAALLHAQDHLETLRSVRALRLGVAHTLLCAAALVTAVALTWYGPVREALRLLVRTATADFCGQPVRVADGRLTLKTSTGEVTVSLADVVGLGAVDTCPAPAARGAEKPVAPPPRLS
ncbi:hypothetical protein N6Q81_27325 [Streptomyces vinaceusdrappus]|uniref:Integral membrane protein n=1 Tax=Streptomyces vinaceusdrappus TaxID=67376 RepID=A0ABY6C201_9ACTN|nr:hypothetical protein [Streptomyces vinaceusdrappus]UXI81496.1 hypothetical protein N6Q81_27325 [Streptomyces vinaceusdrappus]